MDFKISKIEPQTINFRGGKYPAIFTMAVAARFEEQSGMYWTEFVRLAVQDKFPVIPSEILAKEMFCAAGLKCELSDFEQFPHDAWVELMLNVATVAILQSTMDADAEEQNDSQKTKGEKKPKA